MQNGHQVGVVGVNLPGVDSLAEEKRGGEKFGLVLEWHLFNRVQILQAAVETGQKRLVVSVWERARIGVD